jgi:hypothetical protein
VVGDRVALACRAVTVDVDRALAVEVRRRLVAIEVVEDGCKRFAPMQDVTRLAAVAVHVDGEDGVVGEERFVTCGVAAVGAVGVRVEELAQGESVCGFGRSNFSVHSHRYREAIQQLGHAPARRPRPRTPALR